MNLTERRAVGSLAMVYASRMLGLFMVLPVLVLYGSALEDATPELLGFAMGAYGLSQALLQLPYGMLSDRLGRKPLIYFGLILFALGSVVAAQADSVYGLIAGRFLQGAGAVASVLMALLSDLTREESRTRAMAVVGMVIGLSFSVSLVVGPLVGNVWGLSGIFWLTTVLALLSVALVARVPTPVRPRLNRETQPLPGLLLEVLRNPVLLRLNLGIFALHLVLTATFLALPVLLESRIDLPRTSHWWVYLSVTAVAFVLMVPFIVIGEKYRKMKPVFLGAIALLGLSALTLWQVPDTLLSMWGALLLFFMAFNLLEASLPSLVSKACPPGSRGSAMGVYSTAQFLGAFVGGALGGKVLGAAGPDGVLLFMAGVVALWWLVALQMPAPSHATSFVVKLAAHLQVSGEDIARVLSSVRGVEDVVVLPDEGAAYLKVDRAHLDEAALRACPYLVMDA